MKKKRKGLLGAVKSAKALSGKRLSLAKKKQFKGEGRRFAMGGRSRGRAWKTSRLPTKRKEDCNSGTVQDTTKSGNAMPLRINVGTGFANKKRSGKTKIPREARGNH